MRGYDLSNPFTAVTTSDIPSLWAKNRMFVDLLLKLWLLFFGSLQYVCLRLQLCRNIEIYAFVTPTYTYVARNPHCWLYLYL